MKGPTPTERTLKLYRDRGYTCQVVERWNQWAKVRQDLFGFIDIIAMKKGEGIIGIQCTSASNHAARKKKIIEEKKAEEWFESGGRVRVVSWRAKPVGKRKKWIEREEEICFPF